MDGFLLHELHSLPLPSNTSCFNALRVCKGEDNINFVKLSTMKQMSCELVKSRRAPFKLVLRENHRADEASKVDSAAATSTTISNDLDTSTSHHEDEAVDLIVSNDAISGNEEDWEK